MWLSIRQYRNTDKSRDSAGKIRAKKLKSKCPIFFAAKSGTFLLMTFSESRAHVGQKKA
jgi:hypothetical protein